MDLPDKLEKIGNSTFEGCTSLESVVIAYDTLTEIGSRAFFGCNNLQWIGNTWSDGVFDVGESVEKIGEGAFNGCVRMTEITLPFFVCNSTFGN